MQIGKTNYIIEENIYKSIDNLTNSSKDIIITSTNFLSQLTSLLESIEEDEILEILSDAGKINDFISLTSTFTKNELQELKVKSKIAIEKAEKRKNKIIILKEENTKLKEKIKEAEIEKQQLILNIDSISSQLSDIYLENQKRERSLSQEQIYKKNEILLKEKYIKEINDMQKDIDILKEKNKTFENNATKFRRKSLILEEKNKKLSDELGAQTMQFLRKMREQNDLKNMINSLKLKNDDLSKKLKNYEKLQIKYKNLEAKTEKENENIVKKNINSNNFIKLDNTSRKSGKKMIQLRDRNISYSYNDNENDLRYKTFSNLNDLLAEESDASKNLESSKKIDKIYNKKKAKGNFRRYSFDLDYIFEINLNTYENFFG
jgi:exonuclease SbcC